MRLRRKEITREKPIPIPISIPIPKFWPQKAAFHAGRKVIPVARRMNNQTPSESIPLSAFPNKTEAQRDDPRKADPDSDIDTGFFP